MTELVNELTPVTPTPLSVPLAQQSLAPEDVIKSVNESLRADARQAAKVKEAGDKLEADRQVLQARIYDNANPSPLLVATIALATLLTMWILYIVFLKPDASGEWRDELNNKYRLTHNRFTGTIRMRINGKCAGYAKVIDNYFRYGDLVGLWDYSDNIIFVNGIQLFRMR
jgi:hypothetical protein